MADKFEEVGLILKGTVYCSQDGGAWREFGNTTSLTVTNNIETLTRPSKKKGNYGSSLDTIVIPSPQDISVVLDTFNRDTFAWAFLGTAIDLTAAQQMIVDEVHTATLGVPVQLNSKFIDEGSIEVKDSTDTVLTDVTINSVALGLITVNSGITDGDEIKVSYTNSEKEGYTIDGGTITQVNLELKVDGINMANNQPVIAHFKKVVLAPSDAVDLFSDEFNSITLTGSANVPTGEKSPYSLTVVQG